MEAISTPCHASRMRVGHANQTLAEGVEASARLNGHDRPSTLRVFGLHLLITRKRESQRIQREGGEL